VSRSNLLEFTFKSKEPKLKQLSRLAAGISHFVRIFGAHTSAAVVGNIAAIGSIFAIIGHQYLQLLNSKYLQEFKFAALDH